VAGDSVLPLNRFRPEMSRVKSRSAGLVLMLVVILFLTPACAYPKKVVIPPSGPSTKEKSETDADYLGRKIARTAESLVGTPYRYGGTDPNGFDCSGLTRYVYRRYGFELPRRAEDQLKVGRRVARTDLKPGDLVFFGMSWSKDYHVGVFIGDGCFVHAPQSGRRVEIQRLDHDYYRDRYHAARRIISEGQM